MAKEEEKKDAGKKDEAKAQADAAASQAAAPAPKSKKKLFMIVGGVVALVLAAGIPTVIMMKGSKKSLEMAASDSANSGGTEFVPEGKSDEDEATEGEEALGALLPMETFVVNLSGGKYIRCQVQLEFSGREIPNRYYSRLVPIRDGIINILTNRTEADVVTSKGKEQLKLDIRELINNTLKHEDVKVVYFTQFIVQ